MGNISVVKVLVPGPPGARGAEAPTDPTLRPGSEIDADFEDVFERLGRGESSMLNAQAFYQPTDAGFAAAINRAITAANARGGGLVIVPDLGLPLTLEDVVVQKSNVYVYGLGRPLLQGAPGRSLVKSENFDSLRGTGLAGGIQNAGFENFILHGGWTPATASALVTPEYGVAVYGRALRLRGLYITRTRGHALWTEYADQANGSSPWDGKIDDITIVTAGEHGWYNNLDDAHVGRVNIRDPSRAVDDGFVGALIAGGCRCVELNVWQSGSVANLPKYSLHFAAGGGSEFLAVNVEGGRQAAICVETERVKLYGRAHSTAGEAALLLLSNKNTIDLTTYRGDRNVNARPMKLGDGVSSPAHNDVRLSIAGYTQPIDWSGSGGGNTFNVTGSHDALTLNSNLSALADDLLTVNIGGSGAQSMGKVRLASLNAAGTTAGTASIVRHQHSKIPFSSSTSGVRMPSSPAAGDFRIVTNTGTTSGLVYPHAAGRFLGRAVDEPISIAPGQTIEFRNVSSEWAVLTPQDVGLPKFHGVFAWADRPLTGVSVGDEIIVTDLLPRQRWSWNGTAWVPNSGRLPLLNKTFSTPLIITGTTSPTVFSGSSASIPLALVGENWRLSFRAMVDRNAAGVGSVSVTPRVGGVSQETRSLPTTTLGLALDTDYGFASDTILRRQGGVSRNASSATSTFGAATIPSTLNNVTVVELQANLTNAADSVTLYSVAYELLAPA